MKRKIAILLLVVLSAAAVPVFSRDREIKTVDLTDLKSGGRFKLGLALGYPTGVTLGIRINNWMEPNFIVGTKFRAFTFGGNFLFTIVNFSIGEHGFLPLSIGPAVLMHAGGPFAFGLDLYGVVRLEYSFQEVPINLFIEGGPGVSLTPIVWFEWTGALGVRYIF
ncbi:MAG: hypothetical protein ACLFRY_08955 [Spirochaetia bacterium]